MGAGPTYEYLWADEKQKKPLAVSAPEYVGLLMDWIQAKIDDEEIFPARVDVPFPRTFVNEVIYYYSNPLPIQPTAISLCYTS